MRCAPSIVATILGLLALPSPARAADATPDHPWLAEGQRILLYGEGSYLQTLAAFREPVDLHVTRDNPLDEALDRAIRRPAPDRADHGKAPRRARQETHIKKAFATETLSFAPTLAQLPNAWAIQAKHKTSARVTMHLESDPLHQTAGRAPGLSLPIFGPLEAGMAWLPGHTMGFEPELTVGLRKSAFRPSLGVGFPLLLSDPTRHGISGVGGFEWLATRDLRFFAQVGAVRWASVPTGYAKDQIVPTIGWTGRL